MLPSNSPRRHAIFFSMMPRTLRFASALWCILLSLSALVSASAAAIPEESGSAPDRIAATSRAAELAPGAAETAGRSSPDHHRRGRAAARKGRQSEAAPPDSLEARLSAVLQGRCLRGARLGVEVISLRDGKTVFERNPLLPLAPASTMKVLTTGAILKRLGADFRYQTLFLTDGRIGGGALRGNLYVRGVGAPDLVMERWGEIANDLAALGISEIDGDVVGDESYFDAERRAPGWPSPTNSNPYNAPISALSANFNTVQVSVLPTKAGQKPMVLLEPSSDLVRAVNSARTASGTALRMRRSFDGQANTVTVKGTIGARAGIRIEWLGVEDPPRVAASVLKAVIEQSGVKVQGKVALGLTPPDAELIYAYPSKPLAEIVADANKNSINFIAECLQRTLGAAAYGTPGSREKGARAVRQLVADSGGPIEGLELVDGSGLSTENRVTVKALVSVLAGMLSDERAGPAFLASLPIAGEDGTLRHRLLDARGRVRAKTGSINSARGLAGYVLDLDDRPAYAFAVLVNGYRCGETGVLAAMDDIARVLVEAAGTVSG